MNSFKRFFYFFVIIFALLGAGFYILYDFSIKLLELNSSPRTQTKYYTKPGTKKSASKATRLVSSTHASKVTREFIRNEALKYPSNKHNIVLIGLDGATLNMIYPLIRNNRIPFIDEMVKNGVHGPLQSLRPIKSPVIWTSIATGKTRYKHGIKDFVTIAAGSMNTIPVTRHQRKVKAVWNMLTDFDRESLTINWWASSPPESVKGCLISDFFEFAFESGQDRKLLKKVVFPPQYESAIMDIDKELDAEIQFWYDKILEGISFKKPDTSAHQQALKQLKEFIRSDLLVFRASQRLLKDKTYDLASIYFQGIDVISHHFWGRGYRKDNKNQEYNPGGPVIEEYYIFTDVLLNKLKNVADNYTDWIIVSDHGFHSTRGKNIRKYFINRLFESAGVLEFLDDQNRINLKKSLVYDLQTHDLWEINRSCYINLIHKDIPESGSKLQNLRAAIDSLNKLFSGIKTTSGTKVFRSITRFEKNRNSENPIQPDLVFRFNPQLSIDEKIIINGKTIEVNKFIKVERTLPGSHELRGIFIASGEDFFSDKKISGISVLDITPTILHLLGMPVAEDFDGKIIAHSINHKTVSININMIPTYETDKKLLLKKSEDKLFEEKVIKQLKGIGYLN